MTSTPPTGAGGGPERFADDAHRYRLDSRIATGGMGEVWRGTDTTLGRSVAVKLLKHEYADDPTFRARFQTEAQHAASLHHPGVASVYDFGEASPGDGSGVPRPYLVMELVNGKPLSDLLRGGQRLDPDAVRQLLAQAAAAIAAAHAAGIVHRDVKPANLIVTPDRTVKITDFGIARATDGLGLTGTGQVMGTPQYLSPEQARGKSASPASDVYSLGVVAFECLAGRRPFDADSPVATALAHLNDDVPDLPDDVPADLAAVVHRSLAKDPAARYPDASAFAAALRNPSGGAATGATAVVPPTGDATQVLPGGAAGLGAAAAAGAVGAASAGGAANAVSGTDSSGTAGPDPTPTPVDPPVTPGPPPGGRPTNPWPLVGMVLLLVSLAVIIVLLVTGGDDENPTEPTPTEPTTSEPSEPTSSAPTEAEPETFDLDESAYVGRDVDEASADLRGLGLSVDAQQVENPGDREADTVESVSPTQGLSEGDRVTVTYYGPQPEPTEEPEPTLPVDPSVSEEPSPSESQSPSESPSGSASPAGAGAQPDATPPADGDAGSSASPAADQAEDSTGPADTDGGRPS